MICMNNGFILSDKFRNQPVTHHKQLFIDKVEAKLKSGEIISIPLEGNSLPKLPANLKSIRISVGYPFSTGVDRFYQYKLSGIDKDWYQPSVQSSIRYERLPHGKYKLEIRPLTRNTAYENEVDRKSVV